MESLTILQQIEIVEKVKKEIKQNIPYNGLCCEFRHALDFYCRISDYIPLFTRETATLFARKYKFKKPYEDGAHWWDSSYSLFEERNKRVDVKNRICFLNALIKELKTQL